MQCPANVALVEKIMKNKALGELELRAIVDFEIRSAMGEIGGELAEERSEAMDYYLGEPVGKLQNPSADRSGVVLTIVRDTVEWLLPQLMRLFAQADSVVTFDPINPVDEHAAKKETTAINHIFWRKNDGFLLLYTWFKDALLQKNGIVKYYLEEREVREKEEKDGLTDQMLSILLEDPELEAIEHDISEIKAPDGSELHHVVFERTYAEKSFVVENVPPEEFLLSNDARSLNIQEDAPRFVGHYTEKSLGELVAMGFDEVDIEAMKRGDERWNELDEEWIARYNLSDEQEITERYAHESMRRIRLVEGYMRLDMDGDKYPELVRIFRAGEFISYEPADFIPFIGLTPNIMPHKFFGLSVFDMVHDLQEIATATMRNVLDNMYQVNNTRPVANQRVDVDSLLVSSPGAPIWVDDEMPVEGSIAPFAPPPMWKDGLGLLEYLDAIRKDRTGVGDETMGLDPTTMASANTGVVLASIEAARGKIELIARIFAETGLKWLFKGLHELARKSFEGDMTLRMGGQYISVKPQEWQQRKNVTVNVGTAASNVQQKQAALQQVAQMQELMVQGGLMGKTITPSNIFQTGRDMADLLGLHGDKFFLNPMSLALPEVQALLKLQLPQPGPDPQMVGVQAMAEAEQMKARVSHEKVLTEAALKEKELQLRFVESAGKGELATLKNELDRYKVDTEAGTKQNSQAIDTMSRSVEAQLEIRNQDLQASIAQLKAELEVLKTSASLLQSSGSVSIKEEELALKVAGFVSEQLVAAKKSAEELDTLSSAPNIEDT